MEVYTHYVHMTCFSLLQCFLRRNTSLFTDRKKKEKKEKKKGKKKKRKKKEEEEEEEEEEEKRSRFEGGLHALCTR